METTNEKRRNSSIKRIVVIGPESTGKTTLAEQLANHYNTTWVPEYAREYLENINRKYTLRDIENISKGQLKAEEQKKKSAVRFLFCDTNLIVSKIWTEYVFKTCPKWILKNIETNIYDFYLLTNIDLTWMPDKQREHPDQRAFLFNLYKKELQARKFPFVVISGKNKERVKNAVSEINKFITT